MNDQESSLIKTLRQVLFGERDAGFEDDRAMIKKAAKNAYWGNPWNRLSMMTFLKDKGVDSNFSDVRQKYEDYLWREAHYGDGSMPIKKSYKKVNTPIIAETYKEAR